MMGKRIMQLSMWFVMFIDVDDYSILVGDG